MTPIVYLHGFASSPASRKARFFHDQLTAAGASVTIPALARGDFEHLTISGQLEVVATACGSGPVRLIGSSMGGYLAALHAARSPAVERLVLLAPAFGFNARWPERLGAEQMARWKDTNRVDVFHHGFNEMRPLSYDLIVDAAKYPDYPGFEQPALIFHGDADDVIPVAFAERFAVRHPNCALRILHSGHDLLDVLTEISQQIIHFLAN